MSSEELITTGLLVGYLESLQPKPRRRRSALHIGPLSFRVQRSTHSDWAYARGCKLWPSYRFWKLILGHVSLEVRRHYG